MRRLLTGLVRVPAEAASGIARGWDRFVFRPADPTPLGCVRVAVGLLLTWSLFVYGLDLHAYLGRQGFANLETVRAFRDAGNPSAWSFWFQVPDAWLRPVWVACLLVLAAFTVGLWSRVTAVLAWIIAVSTANRAPISVYGFDDIVTTWAFYLAVTGASGQAVSIDRFLARWRLNRKEVAIRRKDGRWVAPGGLPAPSVSANIAIRLIQCHLVLIYAVSGLAKHLGPAWWGGTAIWSTLAAGEFRLFDLTGMANHPFLLNAMTHAAIALEILYPALIWVRPVRPYMIAGVVAMHVGIGLTLGLFEFSLAMIAANLAFCSAAWLRSLVSGTAQPSGRVLYDGACPRCRASMALITASDPDRVLSPVDLTSVDVSTVHPSLMREACMKSMHLVHADGRVEVGYDAVMTLLGWCPIFSPMALVRYLPGVSFVGKRVYDRVASTRPRDQPCTDEVCGIHPPPKARTVSPSTPTSTSKSTGKAPR